ncbi:MAG: glutamate 5-kinase [Selenomonas sp.]|uniref:glutamate 5-kinase n=1 Tax=Selenomonas sp. TaxID=2053611 RepID=UPI0025DBE844|nr:glutamate 5-kinase [Selenomonas sp.]MCI6231014.1 glutamate 5-kinase [Selenomonas sp.]
MDARESLKVAKRIVVKVGTSTLAYGPGRMNLYNIEHLVRGLVDMANEGREMILVSSGAIAAGLGRLGMTEKPDSIPEKQAIAAVGQGMLMHIYEKFFAEYGKTAAQVLLTRENSVRHNQYIHSREALCAMLEMGAIPVINENDAVTVDEIKIGDNDQLSATVATLVDADALIILSDIDGLYTANPATHPDAQIIHEVPEITPEIERLAGGAGTTMGTGGMMTKIEAAKVAMNAGVTMVIAPGARDHVLRDVLNGEEVGTLFPAKESHLRLRKSWIAFGKRIEGDIVVDRGCEKAMRQCGSSLLAAGIVSAEGEFTRGSTVRVLTKDGQEIARGVVNYGRSELMDLIGRQTKDFPEALLQEDGFREEVIHRDNMVLMV